MTSKDRDTKNYWLDNKKNVDKIWYSLVSICVISVLADFFYHKHATHPVEDLIIGMHGWYSFIVCVFLVLCAKLLRKILMRSEDYYDEINDD